MPWHKVQEASIHSLLDVERSFGFDTTLFSFIEHRMEFVKVLLNDSIVFIANLAKLPWGMAHEVVIEVQLVRKRSFDVWGQDLHTPGFVEFPRRVVIVYPRLIASCSQREFDLLERLAHKGRIKAFDRSLVVVE